MVGDMGHKGGLINPRPRRGQYRAGFSNTGGSPKPRKRAPCKKTLINVAGIQKNIFALHSSLESLQEELLGAAEPDGRYIYVNTRT